VEQVGDLGLEMIAIPGGEFVMGSPEEEPERWRDEGPAHRVTVPPFFMGRYAVTQAQWRVVAGWEPVEQDLDRDPSNYKGDDRPVENVTWQDAIEFCKRLSRETGRSYGLPSEAMWEYACRAGTETAFSFGPMISPEVANYDWDQAYDGVKFKQKKNFEGTVPVGHFPANPWGLYEMHGNVWEWCVDHWHGNYDGAPNTSGGAKPNDGSAWVDEEAETAADRVTRGGSWINAPRNCRSATRFNLDAHDFNYGFRVICLPPGLL
jgi:formylglycine-generating enzyme required for sulfatase activity